MGSCDSQGGEKRVWFAKETIQTNNNNNNDNSNNNNNTSNRGKAILSSIFRNVITKVSRELLTSTRVWMETSQEYEKVNPCFLLLLLNFWLGTAMCSGNHWTDWWGLINPNSFCTAIGWSQKAVSLVPVHLYRHLIHNNEYSACSLICEYR